MSAFYNEIDPYAAQWLRNLIAAGHIAPGVVDDRSIVDIRPDELAGFTQCHFFAGIGGWSYALRQAGWPDDRPVWTGSCPCQPFSAAGKGAGFDDERHLWPSWHWLIGQSRPSVVFGEQVAAKAVEPWIDLVQTDLEALGYRVGAIAFPAASVGAPHIRDRLSFVADSVCNGAKHGSREGLGAETTLDCRDGDLPRERLRAGIQSASSFVGDTDNAGSQGRIVGRDGADQWPIGQASVDGFWADAEWLPCRDGKVRPVEPGIFPLLNGLQQQLDSVFSIQDTSVSEVRDYAAISKTDAHQVLRMVRERVLTQQGGERPAVGMRLEFPSPEILLNFMLDVEAACDGTTDCRSSKKKSAETIERAVRSVRRDGGIVRSPCERKSHGQHPKQPPTTLHELSFILACRAAAYGEAAIKAHAASVRTGLLRGAGNAIVPQAQAEFIRAYLDRTALEETSNG
ncbi:S-adenosyl-L-methionine-dependent methyltransferase [uncultured Caudovirales phage]|uniref:S-adenosyl-L-methionine-dependent methyltransferase n=6 Tax=uncultured Caudovirales phage TaxID=2100421 RepID=A0A6J5T659_9CAUD|nr:S-adenosyl-L-methionine-dependent methyltransferase [uncultured Caudovirales phage]CAB4180949.1 S-adenosyl-L-methionine-dependent methyltransferase [uncultured Caudovirales phage]CAB4211914.1 S-adenosyl-L-methionine-dependent methyltransferase [uncultured Caudovirales phage]CAB4222334.1 S-adenosyl-L-methionine-dependent methyltransferase [uncultured Caudovirales phage]CAB5227478.1 S-adenosyl-L-methionine-dependent methyltransferase [uncultured Caudovirales phage]